MAIKLKQPQIIKASYQIVTPMFIGDAEQKATGISPASVKGALRFWWRALNWGRLASACQSEAEALQQLHEEEAILFGSSAYDSDNKQRDEEHKALIGASRFTLTLDTSGVKKTPNADWPKGGNDPSGYLGMGLWETGSKEKGNFQAARQYLAEGQTFSVKLYFKAADINDKQQQQLKDALLAWGLFGGLGSRARRAFGSVAVQCIDDDSYICQTVENYKNLIQSLFDNYRLETIPLPPFSALSRDTEIGLNQNLFDKARKAHENLGSLFKAYRGSKDSPVRGKVKVVFGLPYADGINKEEKEGRRASPLLLHIHPIDSQFISCALHLPATFHYDKKVSKVDFSKTRDFLTYQDMRAS